MWVETFQPASVRSNADDEVLPDVVSRLILFLVVFVFLCCLTSSYIPVSGGTYNIFYSLLALASLRLLLTTILVHK